MIYMLLRIKISYITYHLLFDYFLLKNVDLMKWNYEKQNVQFVQLAKALIVAIFSKVKV